MYAVKAAPGAGWGLAKGSHRDSLLVPLVVWAMGLMAVTCGLVFAALVVVPKDLGVTLASLFGR